MKTKKLKGGFTPYMTADEKLLVTVSKNTAYVYSLEDGKLQQSIKSLSNLSEAAVSGNKKLLAVKNTSGMIALLSMESGEEIGRCAMERKEGEKIVFTQDDCGVLDFDWDGRTMLLDCSSVKHRILDGPTNVVLGRLPRTVFMHYDVYSDRIYKIMADEMTGGDTRGRVLVSSAAIENIAYHTVREFDNIPDHLQGLSFCKAHNYYVDWKKNLLIKTDKNFAEITSTKLPSAWKTTTGKLYDRIWISEGEKYLFANFGKQGDPRDYKTYAAAPSLSSLYALDTMEKVADFDYEYVSDFLMFDEDKQFVLATWKGSYLGTL
ncbi:MAG: hypothetical protein K2M20_09210 [Lachnospiraceae bacterium]|nr:hypothetical protein [Lachnospiraceae bacterium]